MDSVLEAIDTIDAAVFSGDTFFEDDMRKFLRTRMERWERELKSIEETKQDMDEEV